MSVFKIQIKTLSPLHIGSGVELRQGFDFVVYEKHTWRLNEDAVLQAKADQLILDRDGHYPLPGSLLSAADFKHAGLFRYRLRGFPRSGKADARVVEAIKDVHDRPYIPGSSLKGALRTALAWAGWKEVNPRYERGAIGNSRSWAGQRLERQFFGPDPNHDLLRALHVSDLFGPQKPGEGLLLVNAQVLTHRSAGSPVELEALPGEITFEGSLTIDDTLFSPWAQQELRFDRRKRWLDELLPRVQAHTRFRAQKQVQWCEKAEDGSRLAAFYRQITALQLPANQAVLQIGWGAGWDSKTFGNHLQTKPELFAQLVNDYKLRRSFKGAPRFKAGDPFPTSRRAAMVVKDGTPQAVAPFGWVLLEMIKE